MLFNLFKYMPKLIYFLIIILILFIILYTLYHRTKLRDKKGFFFGFFLIFLFGVRFLVEYVKESQGGIENYLGLLTTGQWLSIPMIILGLIIFFKTYPSKKSA